MIIIRSFIILSLTLGSLLLGTSSPTNALVIGVTGGRATTISTILTGAGHMVTIFGSAPTIATQLTGFDAYVLEREVGTSVLETFVLGGGTLVTEWSAADWALNTVGLLNATDGSAGSIGAGTPVTFTAAGIAAGLSAGLPNPYSQGTGTEFFRTLTSIGAGVDILGTRGAAIPVIIGGASGFGSTLIIGYDWADNLGANNSQLLLNAVNFNASAPIPEPSTLLLLASGLAGLAAWRRKKKA